MVAVEFGEQRGVDGSYTAKAGCAAAVTKAAQKRNMILLTAGKPDMNWVSNCSACVSQQLWAQEFCVSHINIIITVHCGVLVMVDQYFVLVE